MAFPPSIQDDAFRRFFFPPLRDLNENLLFPRSFIDTYFLFFFFFSSGTFLTVLYSERYGRRDS